MQDHMDGCCPTNLGYFEQNALQHASSLQAHSFSVFEDLHALQGWVDTTYVDKDVRIGRGDKGSVFVTIRQKDKQ